MRRQSLSLFVVTPMALAFLLTAFICDSSSAGQTPELIDYQGYLVGNTGTPITDTLNMEFKIYDAASLGTLKWSETQNNIAIIDGLFNVTLGASTVIKDTVFNADARWLEVKVGIFTDLPPLVVPLVKLVLPSI